MAVPTKQYGLILPQKKGISKSAVLQRPSVFGDDSDDETSVGESLQREAIKKKMMKQTRLEMQKALDQDSTVYDYDSVYDDMQKQKLESTKKVLGGSDKRPKYIHQLMKAVEDRKKEQERREERKIQKEREAEGETFADKEAYVTSAYKKKLEEQKEEQEREKRQAEIEAALDVKKQKDLSGFYRHLLNQTVGEEAIPDRFTNQTSSVSVKTERMSPVPSPTSHENIPSSGSDDDEGREQKTGFIKPGGGSGHSNRQYRQRSPSSGSGEERETERDRDRKKKSHRDRERDRDRDRHRGREKDDRYGDRRSDKDRRKDRDRGRDDDRGRGRGDTEREERHRKREKSPKERERNAEREKRRNSNDEKRKDKHQEEEKEGKKEPEKEKTVVRESKDAEKEEETVREPSKEEEKQPKNENEEKEDAEEKANKFVKRSTDQTLSSARERYMARQMARSASKTYIEKEED